MGEPPEGERNRAQADRRDLPAAHGSVAAVARV